MSLYHRIPICILIICFISDSFSIQVIRRKSTARMPKVLENSGRLLPSPQVYKCGDEGREMVVNFVNGKYPEDDILPGECNFRLLITNPDICQIRVDFVDTELMDPVRGECLSQSFTVEGAIWPTGLPPLCGVNNDQHLYLHLEPWAVNASIIDFKVTTVIRGSPYRFGIWLTQIDCVAQNVLKAPPGCTQYLLSEQGLLKSFNYEGYRYLNSQQYQICIQPGRGVCGIRYEAYPGDFGVKKSIQGSREMLVKSGVGSSVCVTDYLLIPEGRESLESVRDGRLLFRRRRPQQTIARTSKPPIKKRPEVPPSQDRYCGGYLSPSGGASVNKPVFARVRSNQITLFFKTSPLQELRGDVEGMNLTTGFKISYAQLRNCEDNSTDLVSVPPLGTLLHELQLQGKLPREPPSAGSMGQMGALLGAETFPNGTFLTGPTNGETIDRGDIREDDKIWEYLESAEEEGNGDLYDYLL